jgi:hypothetical protein
MQLCSGKIQKFGTDPVKSLDETTLLSKGHPMDPAEGI